MPRLSDVARPDIVDRNPITKDRSFTGTLSFHAFTTRWSYAGVDHKNVEVTQLWINIVLMTSSIANPIVPIGAVAIINSGAQRLAQVFCNGNVGSTEQFSLSRDYEQIPKKSIAFRTSFSDSNYTVRYFGSAGILEYDD